jgi:protein-tyrosine-phosphatase
VVHWSVPDPSRGGTDEEMYPAFRQVAAELEHRIRYWLLSIQNPSPGGCLA